MDLKILNDINELEIAYPVFHSTLDEKWHNSPKLEDLSYKYFYYYKRYPEYFFVAKSEKILGYICCSPNSLDDKELFDLLPHYGNFTSTYKEYPAHLHINCLPESQGLGIGSQLIQALCDKLKTNSVKGVHLITGEKERNVSFYIKNGFKEVQNINGLVLLGKEL